MDSMDWWVKKQGIKTRLYINIKELYDEKIELMNRLIKLEKMINKHEAYIDKLEAEDN